MSRGLRRRRRPYFRAFDPMLLGQSFDPDGACVRRFAPELASPPASVIHQSSSAAPLGLKGASVELGDTHPAPIIDRKTARARPLQAYARVRGR
jgi:deoxyribodipyrimidine photo-lyase